MSSLIDLRGKKFNNLYVLDCAGRDTHNKALWNCRCDCGNTKIVRASDLKKGNNKSCGCMKKRTKKRS